MPLERMITTVIRAGSNPSQPIVTATITGFEAGYVRGNLFISEIGYGVLPSRQVWLFINPWFVQYSRLDGTKLETETFKLGETKTFKGENVVSVDVAVEFDDPAFGEVICQLMFWS